MTLARIRVAALCPRMMREATGHCTAAGATATVVAGRIRALRAAVGWAYAERIIDTHPLCGMPDPDARSHAGGYRTMRSLHRLRHSVATFLVGQGKILQAQARLGHADAATTLREYAYALPLTDQAVAQAINDHLDSFPCPPEPAASDGSAPGLPGCSPPATRMERPPWPR